MRNFKALLVMAFLTITMVHPQFYPPYSPYGPYMNPMMMGGGMGMGGVDPLTGALIGGLIGGVAGLLTGA